jgi:hypothetical protein
MKIVRHSLLIIALAGALTACQGGEHKAARQAAKTAPPSASSTPTSTAGDRATAQKLLLTKSDLPAGWKIAKDDLAPISLEGMSGSPLTFTATVPGKGFEKGTQAVASGAQIVRPGDDLAEYAAFLRTPEFRRTLKHEFGKAMAEGNPGGGRGPVSVKPLQIGKYGQYSIGYRAATKITTQGFGIRVYMDMVWLAAGRSTVAVSFAGADGPFDPALQKELIAKLGTRLAAAG